MMSTATWPSRAAAATRLVVVGGLISYRALFNWVRPSVYIPSMLGAPLFQIVFFTELGRFSRTEDAQFFTIGNAVQVCAMSCLFAMGMAIANERYYDTLGPLLATPANRAAIFLARTWPVMLSGLFTSLFGLGVGEVLLGLRLPGTTFLAILVVLLVSVASCTAFGVLLGAIGLQTREVILLANVAYFLMLLLCGVAVPRDVLPGWLSALGSGLPLTHGIAAADKLASGASLAQVSGLIATEAIIGACYATVGYGSLRILEWTSRSRGNMQAF
jgi:ABC-2 type transport system permease protein